MALNQDLEHKFQRDFNVAILSFCMQLRIFTLSLKIGCQTIPIISKPFKLYKFSLPNQKFRVEQTYVIFPQTRNLDNATSKLRYLKLRYLKDIC
jgi:hypothetical protein